MSESTPTTEQVRVSYAAAVRHYSTPQRHGGEAAKEFDRWLRLDRARERAEALRTQRDFFASIDMDVAADYCEQWAIAYDADRIRSDAGIGGDGDG